MRKLLQTSWAVVHSSNMHKSRCSAESHQAKPWNKVAPPSGLSILLSTNGPIKKHLSIHARITEESRPTRMRVGRLCLRLAEGPSTRAKAGGSQATRLTGIIAGWDAVGGYASEPDGSSGELEH